MKVTRYMTDKVVSVPPDKGIRSAFFTMRREEVRHLPVVDDNNALLGIISDRDLRRPEWVDEAPDLAHTYDLDDSVEVKDLMTRNPVAIHTYDHVGKATRLLLKHNFGALPVLDKHDRLVGMLSAIDLLRALQDTIGLETRKKERN